MHVTPFANVPAANDESLIVIWDWVANIAIFEDRPALNIDILEGHTISFLHISY